jgi:hypothetical protein
MGMWWVKISCLMCKIVLCFFLSYIYNYSCTHMRREDHEEICADDLAFSTLLQGIQVHIFYILPLATSIQQI